MVVSSAQEIRHHIVCRVIEKFAKMRMTSFKPCSYENCRRYAVKDDDKCRYHIAAERKTAKRRRENEWYEVGANY